MADFRFNPGAVDAEQYEITPAAKQVVGGGDDLLRGRAVNETRGREAVSRVRAGGKCGGPVGLVGDVIKNRHVRHGWLSLKGLAMIMDSLQGACWTKWLN